MSFLKNSPLSNIELFNLMTIIKLEKIISGGQSGVDRAALDASIKFKIPHGGWCPKGRSAEDGMIDACYQLNETDSVDYNVRTKFNIRDSDGTLIIISSMPINVIDGTILTINEVIEKNKPYLIIDLSKKNVLRQIINWLEEAKIKTLNVAGPRESQCPGIYKKSLKLLTTMLSLIEVNVNIWMQQMR